MSQRKISPLHLLLTVGGGMSPPPSPHLFDGGGSGVVV